LPKIFSLRSHASPKVRTSATLLGSVLIHAAPIPRLAERANQLAV
jgi:hypothetical protein